MPIPTDTFWNIKRLNIVFALSAIALMGVTVWAILQDYGKDWRVPQQHARTWDLALTDEKIRRALTPEEKQRLADLQKQIADTETNLKSRNTGYESLVAHQKQLQSDKATLEFKFNNLKSNVQVKQANLQDAITAGNDATAAELRGWLEPNVKQMDQWSEQLAKLGDEIAAARDQIEKESAGLATLQKQYTQMAGDRDALEKRADTLDPKRQGGLDGLLGPVSEFIRNQPLMGFVNPSEKIQQIVLPDVQTDVAFMKITTVDRCMTCHININKKDFTQEKVLAYLEEQVATARKLNLPEVAAAATATSPSATAAKPGPVAMVEFWHNWALKLAPSLITRAPWNTRLATIARSVSDAGPASVTYDGQPVKPPFTYTPGETDPAAVTRQNEILLALFDAFYHWSPAADGVGKFGKATATVVKTATGAPVNTPRNFSMRYAEDIRNNLQNVLPAEEFKLLLDRYRYALVEQANIARRQQGLKALDASSVLLAHPRLDLYVDVDSKHSFEAVGCSSCHDGSGQETDFVLAAHVPRSIYVDARTGAPVLASQLAEKPADPRERKDLSDMLAAAERTKGLYFEAAPSTQPAEDHEKSDQPIEYVDPATGKAGRAVTQMAYWVKTYEPNAPRDFALVYHEWDWPMRTPEFIEVNCARCHTEVYDIKDTAPTLYEGRQLFTQMGCVNCHQMDSIPAVQNRKVGTDLRHVTSKLSREYINTWIWAPKAFRPTTKMPHFFMLENNSSDEELRRTRQEALAITEYLVRTATPLEPKNLYPKSGQGSAATGKELFNSIGCLACHQNLNERAEEWITLDLQKRAGMAADAAKTAYAGMSYNERQLYVQQHLAEPAGHNTASTYADGTKKPEFVQIGPELSGIGTKLTAGRTIEQARQWLFDWVKEPRHYSDYTIMPRLRLSDQQAMDLVEYLLNQKRTTNDPKDTWFAGNTPIDQKKLIELTALQLKARFSWDTALAKADDDTELTADAISALTTPVKPADQAKAEVAQMNKDQKRQTFLGQKLIANYGCMSCHAINGMETTTSPCANLSDWGQKGVDKLAFEYLDHHKVQGLPPTSKVMLVNGLDAEAGNLAHAESIKGVPAAVEVAWPEVEHTRDSWIEQKLKNTRVFDRGKVLLEPSPNSAEDASDPVKVGSPYDKLKMPTFYLNEEQVHAIVTFVLSNRARLITQPLTEKATNPDAIRIARGRELTERYNCVACHQIERNLPQFQQYFKPEDVITKAPPSLRGEGNKIQYNWAFNFFKNVEQMRPLLFSGVRMPSFPANDDEWSAIIAYFNSISNKESADLAKQVDPVNKYVEFQRKATTQPAPADPVAAQPGDDWWQRTEFATAAQTLKDWGLAFGHIRPIEVAPAASQDDLRKVYRTLLFKANFTRQQYAAPFPFVDTPRPEITDERFKKGEQFFYDMQCLKCHVLGDPNVNGANKAPTAPNLSLASRRLQRRWIRHWVQEPNIIQVGTAMPPFFSGLPVFKVEGQPWELAQPLGDPAQQDAHAKKVESDYGATVEEQTDLLLDFIYAAGVRGFTGVQPAQPAASAQPGISVTGALTVRQ